MIKKFTLLSILFVFVATTTGSAMETSPAALESGQLPLKIRVQLISSALSKLRRDYKRNPAPTPAQLRDFNARATSIKNQLGQLHRDCPSLFVACEHWLEALASQESPSRAAMNPADFTKMLKDLDAFQPVLGTILQDPNLSPCCKKAAVALSLLGGMIVTLSGVAYVIAYIIKG